jgi:hypothetical protein
VNNDDDKQQPPEPRDEGSTFGRQLKLERSEAGDEGVSACGSGERAAVPDFESKSSFAAHLDAAFPGRDEILRRRDARKGSQEQTKNSILLRVDIPFSTQVSMGIHSEGIPVILIVEYQDGYALFGIYDADPVLALSSDPMHASRLSRLGHP